MHSLLCEMLSERDALIELPWRETGRDNEQPGDRAKTIKRIERNEESQLLTRLDQFSDAEVLSLLGRLLDEEGAPAVPALTAAQVEHVGPRINAISSAGREQESAFKSDQFLRRVTFTHSAGGSIRSFE